MKAYEPIRGLGKWAVGALAATAVLSAIAVVSDVFELRLLERAESPEGITMDEANANDLRQAVIGILQFLLLIVTAVFFILWFHRAYTNLGALDADGLRRATGWAVGSWFVPILNLWWPKQIANDIWRASDPSRERDQGTAWRGAPVPALYALWWGLWIVGGILANVAFVLSIGAEEIPELKASTIAYILSDSVDVLAAIAAILVVRRTTDRQEARAARVAAGLAGAELDPGRAGEGEELSVGREDG